MTETETITVVENLPPTAVAVANVIEGTAPLIVNFDDSQNFDPEGEPGTYN